MIFFIFVPARRIGQQRMNAVVVFVVCFDQKKKKEKKALLHFAFLRDKVYLSTSVQHSKEKKKTRKVLLAG